jgi:osmotically-inducible protein OsmY
MKKLFTIIALGSTALVSANQYYQPYGNGSNCPSCNNGGGYYQEQPNNSNYYQQNQRQGSQGYSQRDERNYQGNNPYDNQQQSSQSQSYDRNQQYSQQNGNQSYDRNQQRNNDTNYISEKADSQKIVSDQELNKNIQDTLSSGWFSKGFQNVSFDVNNGNVNLRGSVDTIENKNKVEDSVKKIEGVKQVNNQITIAKEGPNAYSDTQLQDSEKKYPRDFASSPQDRQLNAKIRDKLSNGWFSKGNETLVLRTTNGVVSISGTVDKFDDIQKLDDQLKDINGVRSFNNQLTVKSK